MSNAVAVLSSSISEDDGVKGAKIQEVSERVITIFNSPFIVDVNNNPDIDIIGFDSIDYYSQFGLLLAENMRIELEIQKNAIIKRFVTRTSAVLSLILLLALLGNTLGPVEIVHPLVAVVVIIAAGAVLVMSHHEGGTKIGK